MIKLYLYLGGWIFDDFLVSSEVFPQEIECFV